MNTFSVILNEALRQALRQAESPRETGESPREAGKDINMQATSSFIGFWQEKYIQNSKHSRYHKKTWIYT